jgi:hypothetical protein
MMNSGRHCATENGHDVMKLLAPGAIPRELCCVDIVSNNNDGTILLSVDTASGHWEAGRLLTMCGDGELNRSDIDRRMIFVMTKDLDQVNSKDDSDVARALFCVEDLESGV